MRAAHAHGKAAAGHQLTDQIAALDLGNAQPGRLRALGVLGRNRRRIHDYIRAVHVGRIVTDCDANTGLLQMLRLMRAGLIRTGNDVALGIEQRRQTRHGAAADADEVHSTTLVFEYALDHTKQPLKTNRIYYNGKTENLQAEANKTGLNCVKNSDMRSNALKSNNYEL